jgi:hypothetical protein
MLYPDSQQIDSGDMQTLDTLLPANVGERRTLADIIFAKLDSGEKSNAAIIQKAHQGPFFTTSLEKTYGLSSMLHIKIVTNQTLLWDLIPR